MVIKNRSYKNFNKYILIDRKRKINHNYSIVCGFLKSRFFSTFINLIKYANGSISYIVCLHGVKLGQLLLTVFSSLKYNKNFGPGCLILVKFLSLHTIFSNITLYNSKFPKYIRAAGTFTKIYQRYDDKELISFKLPTGVVKYLSFDNFVLVGRNSNLCNFKQIIGKAGYNRMRGVKPHVRGVAMNPVDHPHGGRTKTSKPEVSP
jgi:large subunit ribosomal protein L2